MNKELQELQEQLNLIREEQQQAREEYEAKNDEWWNGLTEEERENAFYAVIKRMYKAEVEERGTYRNALYDVFGFDTNMYRNGMNCGYLTLHNMLFDSFELEAMKGVTRFEVIDDKGRGYVKYLKDEEQVTYNLQDDDRTLKVFIDGVKR